MNRKELYAAVKQLGIADALKAKYGDNYTRLSNDVLMKEVAAKLDAAKKPEKKKPAKAASKTAPKVVEPEVCPIVKAIIKLVSTLQYYKAFTDKEAEEILSLLK